MIAKPGTPTMKDIDQIAAEAARQAFSDNETYTIKRYVWNMPPQLPLTESELASIIESAIKKATESKDADIGRYKATIEVMRKEMTKLASRAAHASERDFYRFGPGASQLDRHPGDRAAHASDNLALCDSHKAAYELAPQSECLLCKLTAAHVSKQDDTVTTVDTDLHAVIQEAKRQELER